MSQPPAISLVIVSQDRREELAQLLSALRFQRVQPTEIIIVSNLGEAKRPISDLDILWLPSANKGISADRNAAIAAANCEIIAFCDEDAVPEFCWLEELTRPLELRGVSSSGGYVRGRNGISFQSQTVFFDRYGRDWQQDTVNDEARIYPPQKDMIPKTPGTNCAFKRGDLCDLGGFDEAYQVFLDDADINIRLSDTGRQSAIVPRAEVHQSNAANHWRTSRRVPECLFEIGASKAHFCQQFANLSNIESLLPEFVKNQDTRLRRLAHYGLLDAPRYKALKEELISGFKEGRMRHRLSAEISREITPPKPHPAVVRDKVLVLTNHRQSRRAFAFAKDAADGGSEVTLFLIEYSVRPLRVWFDTRGFWIHRIGIFGRDVRDQKARAARSDVRISREQKRIEKLRRLSAEAAVTQDFR